MREADRPGGLLDEVRGERRLERVVRDTCRTQQGRRGTADRRDEQQRVKRRLLEPVEPACHEPLQGLGYRKRPRRISGTLFGIERTAELEREERIAAGRLVKSQQRGPRKRLPETRLEERLHGAYAERPETKPLDAVGIERLLNGCHERTGTDARGEQEQDVRVLQSP